MFGPGWRAAFGAVLLVLVATPGADASESGGGKRDRWTQLGHDLASTFHNPRAGLTPKRATRLKEAWTYEAPGRSTARPLLQAAG